MSEQGQPVAAPETTLIQQDGAIPETVIPQEPVVEAEAEPEPEKPAAEAAQGPERPKKRHWYQDRIDTTTRQKNELKAELEEVRAKLAAVQPKEGDEQAQAFDPRQFERLIEQKAEVLVQQKAQKARTDSFLTAGNKEFGQSDFMEKCNEVASMGAGDSPEFMSLITDPDIIPDGHKVVAALADHPEEAQRILSLNPIQMAAALTRFASTAKMPEKPISNAPAPIRQIGGTAKSSEPSDDEPITDWMAKRRAAVAARQK